MTIRKVLVLIDGEVSELPAGDSIEDGIGVSEADVIALIEEHMQYDDYADQEVLTPQAGADGLLNFFFEAPVQLVTVHPVGSDDLICYVGVDPDGVPADGVGDPAPGNVKTYFPGTFDDTVQVYAPSGVTVHVTGYRREAA